MARWRDVLLSPHSQYHPKGGHTTVTVRQICFSLFCCEIIPLPHILCETHEHTLTILWSLTNSEIRVVSTRGSCREDETWPLPSTSHYITQYKYIRSSTYWTLTLIFLMKVTNLLLKRAQRRIHHNEKLFNKCILKWVETTWRVPVQDANGWFSVFEAHPAIAVPLVLDGDAVDLHYHFPQLLGCAATFFRTWELFACWSQELTKLWKGNGGDKSNYKQTYWALFCINKERYMSL